MRKGEIWMIDLNPTEGSEQSGLRPVLIVSGNLLNEYAPVVWICPLTTKIKKYHGDLILTPNKTNGLKKRSEVLNLHLRTVAKSRMGKRIGQIHDKELQFVRKGLGQIMTMD